VGSRGIPARLKLPIQVLLAIPVAYFALSVSGYPCMALAPCGSGYEYLLPFEPLLVFPLAVIAIVATANAVNITDGMDGLAGACR